jgi:putative flippase GtrA
MILIKRLSRFGIVGVIATAVHTLVLLTLVRLASMPTGPSNLLAFVVAFLFSTSAQQAFTFNDRLAGQSLKKRSVAILFLVNAVIAYVLGTQVSGSLIYLLAFVPSIVNFSLLHFFSGHPNFKR